MRYWVENDRTRGKWRARIVLDNGVYGPSRRFATKREANDWLAEQRVDRSRGTWIDSRKGRLVVADYIPHYLNTQLHLERPTRLRKESSIRNWILPFFSDRPIGSITQVEVQSWVAGLSTKMSPGSVQLVYQVLHQLMETAVEAEIIQRSPCRKIHLPAYKPSEQRYLSLVEILALADAIVPMYRAFVLVAGTGGLRMGEMAGLRLERCDLFSGTLDVCEQLRLVNGRPEMATLKSGASRRQVRLPKFAADALRHHVKVYEPGPTGTVFSSWEGQFIRSYQFRRRYFEPAGQRAGLGHITPHALRHSAVSLWIASGANVKEVQRMAGHASSSVTLNTYSHLFVDFDRRITDGLDSQFNDIATPGANVVRFPSR